MANAHDYIHPDLLARARRRTPRGRAKRKARAREKNLNQYGLTVAGWNDIFDAQGKRCAICGTDNPKRWATDHCHKTTVVRGILCCSCNLALGLFGDSPERLRKAAEYLNHRRRQCPTTQTDKS